ncbi:RICIN domain-containing protein [Solwaraspora sp. WMMD1047]|uniref:ricin-type beta-trefoil lectin domain protein n=1 Tax=Solwaraspora sp. WMMD1047 TaxID=3016102 RepID=UPI0024168C06|nr:RICIN domain-containing protein [Solwaraspora sp. WMMD1047]MDG4828225.1 RICIN domain-containing protein [Solwaraspora sp. WMMD1047]
MRHRWRSLIAVAATVVLASAGLVGVRLVAAAADTVPLAATAGCGRAPGLNSGTHTIQSSGQNRSFILRVPANYNNNNPYRLIFAFHWRGGTMNDVSSGGSSGSVWSYYGMQEQSNNTAILVAPQGIGNGWANSGGQDVTFVDDMIRRIDEALCVDTTQRFALGFSYGGGMSYALACARANVFRAVAVYSGAQLSGCSGGTQPIAYFGLHGISDNVLNISAGRSLRDTFVRNNGCAAQSPREPSQGSGQHFTTLYSCRAGYPVQWAAYDSGHGPAPVDGCSGCEDGARTWTRAEVWRFFAQFQGGSQPTPTPPGQTTPPPTDPGGNRLRSEASGRCLDVSGANSANGAQVQIWDCHSNANQQFVQNGQALQVMGKCLDAPPNAAAGTRVQIWDCNGGANQRWTLNGNGTISNVQTGLCLDVNGAGTANGTGVVVWNCHSGANQRWSRA